MPEFILGLAVWIFLTCVFLLRKKSTLEELVKKEIAKTQTQDLEKTASCIFELFWEECIEVVWQRKKGETSVVNIKGVESAFQIQVEAVKKMSLVEFDITNLEHK